MAFVSRDILMVSPQFLTVLAVVKTIDFTSETLHLELTRLFREHSSCARARRGLLGCCSNGIHNNLLPSERSSSHPYALLLSNPCGTVFRLEYYLTSDAIEEVRYV